MSSTFKQYVWRISVSRTLSSTYYFFNPRDRMFSHAGANELGGSFMWDAPTKQTTHSTSKPLTITFDRPMKISQLHLDISGGGSVKWNGTTFTHGTHNITSIYYTQTVTFSEVSPNVTLGVAFTVAEYTPAIMLVNNSKQIAFDTPNYSTVFASSSRQLALQVLANGVGKTIFKAELVST